MAEDILTIPVPGTGEGNMAESVVDSSCLSVVHTALAGEFGAAAGRRTASADQLSGDSQRMWTIHMTSPAGMAGMGYRTMVESGAGRTRIEANDAVGQVAK